MSSQVYIICPKVATKHACKHTQHSSEVERIVTLGDQKSQEQQRTRAEACGKSQRCVQFRWLKSVCCHFIRGFKVVWFPDIKWKFDVTSMLRIRDESFQYFQHNGRVFPHLVVAVCPTSLSLTSWPCQEALQRVFCETFRDGLGLPGVFQHWFVAATPHDILQGQPPWKTVNPFVPPFTANLLSRTSWEFSRVWIFATARWRNKSKLRKHFKTSSRQSILGTLNIDWGWICKSTQSFRILTHHSTVKCDVSKWDCF